MPINFPDSPTTGDTHTIGDKTWTYDGTAWNLVTSSGSDHGNLGGLADDDHTQYALADGSRGTFETSGAVSTHEAASDPHTQYLLADGTRTATELTVSGDLTVDTDTLAVDSTNNRVGIGTTSPTNTLHVDSGSTAQFAAPQIYVAPSGHASSDRAAIQLDDIQLLTDISGNGTEDFSIYSNNAAAHRLSIDGSGNVGIGTTSPSVLLNVEDGTTTTSLGLVNIFQPNLADGNFNQLRLGKQEGTNLTSTLTYTYNSGTPADSYLSLGLYGNSFSFNIDGSGNVGVGITTPAENLDVSGGTSDVSLLLRSGDVSSGSNGGKQIVLGYSNTASYAHNIRTRHQSEAAAGNAIDFYLWEPSVSSTTYGTKRVMILEGDGTVRTPHQPMFSAYLNSGAANPTGPTTVIADDIATNVGGHYSTSTGRFTAPVDGHYYFSFNAFYQTGTTFPVTYSFRVNSVVTSYRSYDNNSETSYGATSGLTALFTMSAGDYVEVYLALGQLHGNDALMFSGFLVG